MLYIRTDMNNVIATGHVMRCLSIADAAKQAGENTTFILADSQAAEFIEGRGYRTIILHTTWNDMESELLALREVICINSIYQLLIDTYQVTPDYLRELSKMVWTIYIDDLNAFHYPVNALISYAVYGRKFEYEGTYKDTKLYLGPAFAPLRREFSGMQKKHIKDTPQNLLLLSGGTDNYHLLETILADLTIENWTRIDVVCGAYYKDFRRLQENYQEKRNIFFSQAVTNLADYMKHADIAVSAGGVTLYELCAVGTPAISYSFADNQLYNVRQFDEDGIIAYAGDIREINIAPVISDMIENRYAEKEIRRERSKKMQQLIDGNGAARIAEILMKRQNNYFD